MSTGIIRRMFRQKNQNLDKLSIHAVFRLYSRLFASYISRITLCTTRSHIIWLPQTQKKSAFVGELMCDPAENAS